MTDDRVFTCLACNVKIQGDVESTPKRFKYHVKREHKRELQDADNTRSHPYRDFLSGDDISAIRDNDVPI